MMGTIVSAPDFALRDAFLRMLDDYEAHDPERARHYARARDDFAAYVQWALDDERGRIGIVPCSHRWLIAADEIVVGVVRVRHNIDDAFIAREIGHIGYDIAPSHRRRGYGVRALQAGLDHARELGLDRVLLCADTDNPASWKIIERCGGVLESESFSQHYQCLVRRYWITLPK